jgi:DNA replication and repair protein RecF
VVYRSQLEEYLGEEEPEAAAVRSLEDLWANDLERGTTSIGTHRDDIEFMLAGKSMRNYGSQGEQRSAVLALLLADAGMEGEGGVRPLLLLDDVLSELDPERRALVLTALGNGINSQVIITAADRNLVPPQELARASVIEIGEGDFEYEREGSRV